MELCGVELTISSGRCLQTDGASEIMNRIVENHLRCYCNYHQDYWGGLLPEAEFPYNSAVIEDLGMNLFEVELGWYPKTSLYLVYVLHVPNGTVSDFKERLKDTLDDAKLPTSWQMLIKAQDVVLNINLITTKLVIKYGSTSLHLRILTRNLKSLINSLQND